MYGRGIPEPGGQTLNLRVRLRKTELTQQDANGLETISDQMPFGEISESSLLFMRALFAVAVFLRIGAPLWPHGPVPVLTKAPFVCRALPAGQQTGKRLNGSAFHWQALTAQLAGPLAGATAASGPGSKRRRLAAKRQHLSQVGQAGSAPEGQ
ncbi:hypothetical protein AOLI_G00030170 [Acnodon oligacanthus]